MICASANFSSASRLEAALPPSGPPSLTASLMSALRFATSPRVASPAARSSALSSALSASSLCSAASRSRAPWPFARASLALLACLSSAADRSAFAAASSCLAFEASARSS